MHDIFHGTAPINLTKLFKLTSEIHHHNTRSTSSQCFYVENAKTEKKKRSFVITGTKIWNGLPSSLKILSKLQFRSKIKSLLFDILELADDCIDFSQIQPFAKIMRIV